MVICNKAAEPWSTRSNRKPRAAFSAAFLFGYFSRVPITLFRGARRPSGLVSRHRNTQICLPLEETSRRQTQEASRRKHSGRNSRQTQNHDTRPVTKENKLCRRPSSHC